MPRGPSVETGSRQPHPSPLPSESSSGAKLAADSGSRNLIRWMSFVSRLAALRRFSMERLSNPESVMEHLGQVTLTCYALAVEVTRRDSRVDLSVAGVLMRAVVHDVEEVVTGDVPRPTKHASVESKRLFEDLSVKAMAIVRDELGDSLPHFAELMERMHAGAKLGREGCVVALADVLAVVTKVWEETILRGSGAMIRQAHTARRQLVNLQHRIDNEFEPGGEAHKFLTEVVLDALQVTAEAIRRDSKWLGTKAEVY